MKTFKMRGINVKEGVIDLYGERVVLLPPDLINLLASVYGEGSKSILVFLGKKMGRRLSETWEEHLKPKTLEDLTKIFCQFVSTGGWGELEPEKISEDEIIVKVSYNIATEIDPPTKHICYFLNGILSGFGEFALYRASVEESECSIEGKTDKCVFIIKKKSETSGS